MTQDIKRTGQNQDFLTALQQLGEAAAPVFQIRNFRKETKIVKLAKISNHANCHKIADFLKQIGLCSGHVMFSAFIVEPELAFVNSRYSVNNTMSHRIASARYGQTSMFSRCHRTYREIIRAVFTRTLLHVVNRYASRGEDYCDFSGSTIMSRILTSLIAREWDKKSQSESKNRVQHFSQSRGTGKGSIFETIAHS